MSRQDDYSRHRLLSYTSLKTQGVVWAAQSGEAPRYSRRCQAHREPAAGMDSVVVAQVNDRQQAALVECSSGCLLSTSGLTVQVFRPHGTPSLRLLSPSGSGARRLATLRCILARNQVCKRSLLCARLLLTPLLCHLRITDHEEADHLVSSQLQSPAADQAVRPDEGLQADLRLLCCAFVAGLPKEVGVQARQPQAFPRHSQRQRRVPQAAQLLCAARPHSLNRQHLARSAVK